MTADIDRGWGGIVAWLVAAVICGAIVLGHSWWEARKIDNPSPTLGGEGEGVTEPQVTAARKARGGASARLPEGDLDLEELTLDLDDWLRAETAGGKPSWRQLVNAGAEEFQVPHGFVIERIQALGLFA